MKNKNSLLAQKNNPEKDINGNISGDFMSRWKSWIVKVQITHMDGHIDEICLTLPVWTFWGEPSEIAASHLSRLVNDLSRHWIQPVSYIISTGNIAHDGTESKMHPYPRFEIPLGKVYFNGDWVDPKELQNQREKQAAA